MIVTFILLDFQKLGILIFKLFSLFISTKYRQELYFISSLNNADEIY